MKLIIVYPHVGVGLVTEIIPASNDIGYEINRRLSDKRPTLTRLENPPAYRITWLPLGQVRVLEPTIVHQHVGVGLDYGNNPCIERH